jgi:tetratricopeptide (TPR) repeat protein
MVKSTLAALRFALLAVLLLQAPGCSSPEDRAQNHYERGMKLLAQNEHVKASIEFKNALQLKKDLVGAWRGLAQIEERNQNWEALYAILRTIVDLDKNDVNTRVRLARLMLMANQLDQALQTANAATELDSRNLGARVLRAAILLKLNDNKGAIEEAQAVLDADPKNSEAVIVLAAERLGQGDTNGALTFLNQTSGPDDNFGIQLLKMKVYERKGDQGSIEALLQQLIQKHPKENVYRQQLVKLYVDQKRSADAEKELRAIASANPTDFQAGLNVARYLHTIKGATAARQELQTRVGGGGDVFQYQIALAELYFAEGNTRDAELLLEKLGAETTSAERTLMAQAKLAEMYLSSKKIDAAESLLAKVLEKDKRNATALRLRATLQMDRGKFDAAISDLRQALNDQPRSADLMSLLAIAYERSGSMELADKQFADAARVSNFDATVGLTYVAFLRRRGSVARAEDILVELASRSPGNVAVLSTLAEVRLLRQNWAGAQEIADALRKAGDQRGIADQVLGAALSGQKKYDEGITVLQSAYESSPGDVQPMFALVNALVRAQKVDRAVAFLQTVLNKDAGNAEAHVLMGSTQLLRNAPAEALKSFKTAIERQPKKIVGYRALADFYVRQKQTDEALKVIKAGLQMQPDSSALRIVLAGALELKGDYEGAIAEYESILKQEPGSVVVANNLASLLTDRRTDRTSHERAYNLALSLRKSQVPHFKDTLGWIHYQRGEHKAALALLEEATTELPNLPLVRYHLAMNYIALSESAKAEDHLKKALEQASSEPELGDKIRTALQQSLKN